MEHYERLEKIGEGAAGVVYKARDRRTGETVAIKRLRAAGRNDSQLSEDHLREMRCLMACRGHPCLVELWAAGRDASSPFLVMEFVGPSLAQVMRDRGGAARPFPEAETRRLMRQLLDGAAAMHALGVLHRDLKPDNVLVDAHGNLKICDFGLSRFAAATPYTSPMVTLWYRAPELLLGSREYDAGVDTWALGCIMAELLAGAPLLPGCSEMDQLNKTFDTVGTVGTGDMTNWPSFARLPRSFSPLCRRIRPPSRLRKMFPLLSAAGLDVLSGLLACRPDRRLTAAGALRRPWFTDAESPDQPRSACGARFGERVGGAADAIIYRFVV